MLLTVPDPSSNNSNNFLNLDVILRPSSPLAIISHKLDIGYLLSSSLLLTLDPEPEKLDNKSTSAAGATHNNDRGSAPLDNTNSGDDDKSTSEESNEPITLHPELIVRNDNDNNNLESPYTSSYQLRDRKPQVVNSIIISFSRCKKTSDQAD